MGKYRIPVFELAIQRITKDGSKFNMDQDATWIMMQHGSRCNMDKDATRIKLRHGSRCNQGLTGRVFQLRVGSGSGIGKNYRVGSGLGLGIIMNRVLSGVEILVWVFPYFVIFNSWSWST